MKDSLLYLVSAIVIMAFLILLSARSLAVGDPAPPAVPAPAQVPAPTSAAIVSGEVCANKENHCVSFGPQVQAASFLLTGKMEDCMSFMNKSCAAFPKGSSPMSPALNSLAPIAVMGAGAPPMAPALNSLAPIAVMGAGAPPMAPGAPPMAPGASPMAPGASPMAPGASPMAPGASPMAPGASPMAPAAVDAKSMQAAIATPPMAPGSAAPVAVDSKTMQSAIAIPPMVSDIAKNLKAAVAPPATQIPKPATPVSVPIASAPAPIPQPPPPPSPPPNNVNEEMEMIGVGTDNKLYEVVSENPLKWRQIPSTCCVMSVTKLRNGTYLGVGMDNAVYETLSLKPCIWKKIQNSGNVTSVIQAQDGYFIGLGMDKKLWRSKTMNISDGWNKISDQTCCVLSFAQTNTGSFVGIGTDNEIWVSKTMNVGDGWTQLRDGNNNVVRLRYKLKTITQTPSGIFVGTGTDNLVYMILQLTPFFGMDQVPNSGSVISFINTTLPRGPTKNRNIVETQAAPPPSGVPTLQHVDKEFVIINVFRSDPKYPSGGFMKEVKLSQLDRNNIPAFSYTLRAAGNGEFLIQYIKDGRYLSVRPDTAEIGTAGEANETIKNAYWKIEQVPGQPQGTYSIRTALNQQFIPLKNPEYVWLSSNGNPNDPWNNNLNLWRDAGGPAGWWRFER